MAKNDLNHPLMWEDSDSHFFLNPRLQDSDRKLLEKAVDKQSLLNMVWLKTSGTEMSKSGTHKLVALSKKAILYAAMSVNKFFKLKESDIWLNGLPVFHIGGLSIYARAYLAESKVISIEGESWSPLDFVEKIKYHEATLTSLVPTQIYDLVKNQVNCPKTIRFVFVGGGALDEKIYIQARGLGWPLILSYGMTETSAMIAASSPDSLYRKEFPEMHILPHVHLEIKEKALAIRTQALLTGYLFVSGEKSKWTPFVDEFYSDDRVSLRGETIDVLGRASDLVKILGETVDIGSLEKKFTELFSGLFTIVARPEERKGYELILISEQEIPTKIIADFNDQVMPFERLECVQKIDEIPRNPLGKVMKQQILDHFLS